MALTNQDIIFASLMGSKAVATYQRTQLVQNELSKHVLPNIPFLPLQQNESSISNGSINPSFRINQADAETPEEKQFFPLSFSFTEGGQKWLFPYEPMINISSGNNIIKRSVAKHSPPNTDITKRTETSFGTVKERWSRKDFDIQVTGVLIGSLISGTVEDCFPKKKMIELFEFLNYAGTLFVYSEPLAILGINKVVVEDYSFPFTKGENVQAYDIKLVSDTATSLLLKEEF